MGCDARFQMGNGLPEARIGSACCTPELVNAPHPSVVGNLADEDPLDHRMAELAMVCDQATVCSEPVAVDGDDVLAGPGPHVRSAGRGRVLSRRSPRSRPR
jgi:hypothetical protein